MTIVRLTGSRFLLRTTDRNDQNTKSMKSPDTFITLYSFLTYSILNYPSLKSLIAPQQVQKDIAIAFRLWSEVIPIDFELLTDQYNFNDTDIAISFGARRHGPVTDVFFDGTGGAIAHVFKDESPEKSVFGGFPEIHFDDDEIFTRQHHFGKVFFFFFFSTKFSKVVH